MRTFGIPIALLCCAGLAAAAPKARSKPMKRGAGYSMAMPDSVASSPAYRYIKLSDSACLAELKTRKIPFKRETARGVRTPVRLTGPLHGVEYRTNLGSKARATTPWEIADCRLVLALDDFAELLASHDVTEVRHYSMHRMAPKSWPDGKQAKQHIGGLALDAARFIMKDGTYLDVDQHWNGAIGSATCGEKAAPRPATPDALKLRTILCEAVDRHLFHIVLTPNFNRPHKNHFHLEVTEGVLRWFLIH